jgi:transposase
MKNGRTQLAHKAEHAVDLATGAVVGLTVQDADEGDSTTSVETFDRCRGADRDGRADGDGLEEVVPDKDPGPRTKD